MPIQEYQRALIGWIEKEGADLIEMMGMADVLRDLRARIEAPHEQAAAGRLTKAILNEAKGWSAMKMPADRFNRAAETYYREDLRRVHLREGLQAVRHDWAQLHRAAADPSIARACMALTPDPAAFLKQKTPGVLAETTSANDLATLIHVVVLSIYRDAVLAQRAQTVAA